MRELVHKILVGVLFLNIALYSGAQNSQFSQFYSSPTILGPSFAGITGNSRVVMNFRDQWPNMPATYVTYAVSFDHYLPKLNSGIGAVIYRDQAGSGKLANTLYGVQYTYNVKLNRYWRLRPGIMLAYRQTSLDFASLKFLDGLRIDGTSTQTTNIPPLENKGYIDFSASMLAVSSKLWIGATVDHLLQPDETLTKQGESRIPMKLSVYGGYKFLISKNRRQRLQENVIVSFLYKAQANSDQFDIGAYWNKDPLTLGLWFRGFIPGVMNSSEGYGNLDALVALVGYKLGSLRMGYSYDFTISDLIGTTGGAHEVSLIYEFKSRLSMRRRKKHTVVSCPTF